MPTETSSGSLFWAGWVVSALVTLFLIFDGGTKVLRVTPVLEACAKVGLGPETVVVIGTVLLACTALYVVPRTTVLGGILLTAFLGGAVATHVRAGSSLFETVFPVGFCGLAWLGIVLREPRVLSAILLRH
jgi:DoxX-like family